MIVRYALVVVAVMMPTVIKIVMAIVLVRLWLMIVVFVQRATVVTHQTVTRIVMESVLVRQP